MIREILGFGDDLIARFSDTVDSDSVKVLVYVVAWFQGVFGINTASDIISRAVFCAKYSEETMLLFVYNKRPSVNLSSILFENQTVAMEMKYLHVGI